MKPTTTLAACFAMFTIAGPAVYAQQRYQKTRLVSDSCGAKFTDAHLVNAWGLSRSATSPWWISDNGTGLSTLYQGDGTVVQTLVVTVPPPPGSTATSKPTGTVFNGTTDFELAPGQPARFIFVTEDGTLSGWNSATNPTTAVIKVDHSTNGDIFKGVTIAQNNNANLLYATDFHNGRIEVFDTAFQPVNLGASAFTDSTLPSGYAPFNIQNIAGKLFVTFARPDAYTQDNVSGNGFGYVDEFDAAGNLLLRLEHGSWMNAPWGVALAPDSFGRFGGDILVGNFGSGEIAAFGVNNGTFHGLLRGPRGGPIHIEGLWAIAFGNGAAAGPADTLYFTAGPDEESHGLFGTLTVVADAQNSNTDEMDRESDATLKFASASSGRCGSEPGRAFRPRLSADALRPAANAIR